MDPRKKRFYFENSFKPKGYFWKLYEIIYNLYFGKCKNKLYSFYVYKTIYHLSNELFSEFPVFLFDFSWKFTFRLLREGSSEPVLNARESHKETHRDSEPENINIPLKILEIEVCYTFFSHMTEGTHVK